MTPIKVDDKLKDKIVALRLTGMTQEEIAVECKVSQGAVSRVLRQSGYGGHLIKLTRR